MVLEGPFEKGLGLSWLDFWDETPENLALLDVQAQCAAYKTGICP